MNAAQAAWWGLVVVLFLIAFPIGYMAENARRARTRRKAAFGPTTPAPAPGHTAQVINPDTPTGFALVPQGVVYQTTRPEPVFTDSRGLSVHRVEIPDRAPFLVAHDPAHCGATPPRCWHRSPDLPAWGGWGDWLIELDAIRATGHALSELTITDLRALEAFLEYGRTQRAIQMGTH